MLLLLQQTVRQVAVCLLPADAKAKGYDPCGGQLSVCGYDRYQNTMYCYKTGLAVTLRTLQPLSVVTQATQPGTCSAGCSCMLEADAKAKFGVYSRARRRPAIRLRPVPTTECLLLPPGDNNDNAGTILPRGLQLYQRRNRKGTGRNWSRCSAEVCGMSRARQRLLRL